MLGRGIITEAPSSVGSVSIGYFYSPSLTGTRGIFVDDRKRYLFHQFLIDLAKSLGQPAPSTEPPGDMINKMIQSQGLIAVVRGYDGRLGCFSKNPHNQVPPAFADQLQKIFRLKETDSVEWSSNVTISGKPMPADEVLFGASSSSAGTTSGASAPKQTLAQKWQHPAELSPEEMDYLTGKRTSMP